VSELVSAQPSEVGHVPASVQRVHLPESRGGAGCGGGAGCWVCKTLQHTAAHCSALEHTANTLQQTGSVGGAKSDAGYSEEELGLQHNATHSSALQRTANTLQQTGSEGGAESNAGYSEVDILKSRLAIHMYTLQYAKGLLFSGVGVAKTHRIP